VRRADLDANDGHFILHRVYKDLQYNPWNDALLKINSWAYDNENRWNGTDEADRVVETVYFRTFTADEAVDANLFDDLFNDGEKEPQTAEVGKGFPMKADKWYSMVLPFDVYPYELNTKFKFVCVNILDQNNQDPDVIAFKLNMVDLIPANTPFAIKLGVPCDLDPTVMNLDDVTFENKKIVRTYKPTPDAEPVAIGDDGLVYTEDPFGVRFYGSYVGKLGFSDKELYFSTNTDDYFDHHYFRGGINPKTGQPNNTWMRPTGAYLSEEFATVDAVRTIVMQEEDGSFTEIKSITASTNNVNATEGWFTTNGVKLDAQPTQKGVYIHNGKKVVVK
jgi:hypothetical protein